METSHLGLSFSFSAHFLTVGLCIPPFLLQEEVSLMMSEQGTNLCAWENIIRSHFIVAIL